MPPNQPGPAFDDVSLRAGLPAPAMPPHHGPRPPKPWYRRAWGIAGLANGAFLLLALTCCIGVLLLTAHSTVTAYVTVVVTATSPATKHSTATPSAPQLVTGPDIGGTQAAFTTRYGDPTVANGIPAYQAAIATATVKISLFGLNPGTDGQQRVEILSLTNPDGNAWDAATSTSVVLQFIPPDARHIRDDHDPNVGTLHVYQSAALARYFPASAFTNGNGGGPEPPGTFAYTCDNPAGVGCTIAIGE